MPKAEPKDKISRRSIESKVRECCERIEMNEDSRKEWEFIRQLNNKLKAKKRLGKRAKALLALMQPVIDKYGRESSKYVNDTEVKNKVSKTDTKSAINDTAYLLD